MSRLQGGVLTALTETARLHGAAHDNLVHDQFCIMRGIHKMLRDQGNVRCPIAKRRKNNAEHIEAVIEILPE
jgi:hypothetical protein